MAELKDLCGTLMAEQVNKIVASRSQSTYIPVRPSELGPPTPASECVHPEPKGGGGYTRLRVGVGGGGGGKKTNKMNGEKA